ncbi:hypothetical protein PoB_003044800 [Plakobranchus ocellatus]|uniref:Uncharacterized protein n=1 Tax=Plakobranchus ocellatus TaxID=259542 RepID=A0AAV4ABH9_9GAST|nr:hypothetical protein PoB_003044800 [Plakobranchus ocellatus]
MATMEEIVKQADLLGYRGEKRGEYLKQEFKLLAERQEMRKEAERQERKEEAERQAREKKEEADRKERLELEKIKLDAEMKLLQVKIEAGLSRTNLTAAARGRATQGPNTRNCLTFKMGGMTSTFG